MGDCQSPMSCLIICLVAVIIPRFPRFNKHFLFLMKIISVGNPSVTLRVPAPLSGEPLLWGSLFRCCALKAVGDRTLGHDAGHHGRHRHHRACYGADGILIQAEDHSQAGNDPRRSGPQLSATEFALPIFSHKKHRISG